MQWDHTSQVAGDKTKNSPVSVEIIQNASIMSHEGKTRLILPSSVVWGQPSPLLGFDLKPTAQVSWSFDITPPFQGGACPDTHGRDSLKEARLTPQVNSVVCSVCVCVCAWGRECHNQQTQVSGCWSIPKKNENFHQLIQSSAEELKSHRFCFFFCKIKLKGT